MEQCATDVYTPDHILVAIRQTAEKLAAAADSAQTPTGAPPGPAALNTVLRVLDDTDLRLRYHRILLEAQLNPDRTIDDAELRQTLPVLAAVFGVRLAGRAQPVTEALAEQRPRRAAWRLCCIVRDYRIVLMAGERQVLARIQAYIAGTQDPRLRDTMEPSD